MRIGVEAALVDGVLLPGDASVEEGEIAAVGLAGAGRGIAVPGFVDLQGDVHVSRVILGGVER